MGYLFFFQAEDGIRDADVTGVQTCALPISRYTGACSGISWAGQEGPASSRRITAASSTAVQAVSSRPSLVACRRRTSGPLAALVHTEPNRQPGNSSRSLSISGRQSSALIQYSLVL